MVIDFDTLNPHLPPEVLMKHSAFPDARAHFSEVVSTLLSAPSVGSCCCNGASSPSSARDQNEMAYAASEVRPFLP